MAKEFVLTNDDINRYGFRVLTKGIDIKSFLKNPVMFLNHDRRILPIGKWVDIQKKTDCILAKPEYDEDDELAMKVKGKEEKGILNAVSIGFDVLSISEDQKDLMPGQARPTVTKSELLECSIVDIPGNRGAIKLNYNEQLISLHDKTDLNFLNSILPNIKNSNMELRDQIILKFGLPKEATDEQILNALQKGDANEQLNAAIIALGKAQGLIDDKNEPTYKELVKSNPMAVLNLMQNTKPAKEEGVKPEKETPAKELSISELVTALKGAGEGKADDPKSWDEYQQKNPRGLELLKATDPEKFKQLYKDKYGVVPSI